MFQLLLEIPEKTGILDEWIAMSMRYLRRVALRQNPITKMMLKYKKEHPYQLPQV